MIHRNHIVTTTCMLVHVSGASKIQIVFIASLAD